MVWSAVGNAYRDLFATVAVPKTAAPLSTVRAAVGV
jgi:hypothetical protein